MGWATRGVRGWRRPPSACGISPRKRGEKLGRAADLLQAGEEIWGGGEFCSGLGQAGAGVKRSGSREVRRLLWRL